MNRIPLIASFGIALFCSLSAEARPVRMAAVPALTPDGATLVFEWQEDLWSVASTGGVARALTRHEGQDRYPVISSDGKQIAFMSNRDGTFQTYVMPLGGGEAKQVTFHSEGAAPQDWYPDNARLLVRGTRDSGEFMPHRFITVDTRERLAEEVLFDDNGDQGRWSPDGSQLLFMRDGANLYRRNYRGSGAATLWLFDPRANSFEKVASADGDCRSPLWRPDGKGFYFVNDASGCANIWEKEVKSGKAKQRTFFTDYSVIMPVLSRDGSTMVFRKGFDFYRWKTSGDAAPIQISVEAPIDEPASSTRRITSQRVENQIGQGTTAFTSDGKQIAFSSCGHIWLMDTQVKDPVALAEDLRAYDTSPVFSPDERTLFFLRDTGERSNVWKAKRANEKIPWWENHDFVISPVTDDEQGRTGLSIDPTGRKLAWQCKPGELWVSDLDGKNSHRIIQSPAEVGFDWSPDGKWFVCSIQDSDDNRDVWIYSVDGGTKPYNVSRHPNWDGSAAWSPDGRCIAYIGRTYDNDIDIHYVWLRLADDGKLEKEEKWAEGAKQATEETQSASTPAGTNAHRKVVAKADAANGTNVELKIDFEGLADRVHRVRDVGINVGNLFWSGDSKALGFHANVGGKPGTWKLYFPHPNRPDFMCAGMGVEAWWTKRLELLWVLDGVPATLEAKHNFTVRSERDDIAWRTLGFRLMWRMLRDEFYDARMNNLDWTAVRTRYEAMIPEVDEAGFARIIHMLNGELNASHMDFVPPLKSSRFGGDWTPVTGHPGVVFDPTFAGPGLRVQKVLAHSPADRDITRLNVGDIVLKIDDTDVGPKFDLTRVLNGAMPREVLLVVTNAAGRREFRLPLSTPQQARDWAREGVVQTARDRVTQWSNGKFGYVDIEKMQIDDLRQFEKEIYAEGFGHDGLVIDVRNNTGGYVADRILSIICHPRHAITVPRGGDVSYQGSYIDHAFWMKPVVVLCNQHTASNGEIFSQAIKTLRRGKLIGTQTGGAVISTSDRHVLDLGTFRIPHRAWFNLETGMDMEIAGVKPDIGIPDLPGDRAAGRDEPLKKAVDVLADEIKHQSAPVALKRASEVRPTAKASGK